MNAQQYMANEFFKALWASRQDNIKAWHDGSKDRTVYLCPVVVRVEDTGSTEGHIRDDRLVLVYGQTGEGEVAEDLNGGFPSKVEFSVAAFLSSAPALARFQERFLRLFHQQPHPRRASLAQSAETLYNEDLRAYQAQWTVMVDV